MIQTKDCIEALAKAMPMYGKAWKRLSKRRNAEGNIVREFQSRQNPEIVVAVIATADKILKLDEKFEDPEAADAVTLTPLGKPQDGILARLRANPIKVDLLKGLKGPPPDGEDEEEKERRLEDEKSYSGRVVYDIDEDEGFDDSDGSFGFDCGPETKDGWLSDQDEPRIYDKLKALFADFPTEDFDGEKFSVVEAGAAENHHRVRAIPGVNPRELWKIVEERLRRSGAVPMKKR